MQWTRENRKETETMGYQIIECKPVGPGYDLKLKVSVDGEIRYLYYDEIPDRCYILGWHIYEIDAQTYEAGQQEPYIRYIGSFPGENYTRAHDAVYRALKDGLTIQSNWDKAYGEITLIDPTQKTH